MSDGTLILLIVLSIAIGWLLGRRDFKKAQRDLISTPLSQDYYKGLNYLLNEQPDKALDIFVKALEVNSDTVETHLTLGSLFRRRGEVDRAIKIHQNLLAKPTLDRSQSENVQLALAQDFLAAGLLDRAEHLLLTLVELGGEKKKQAVQYLVKIFEQEKEWKHAIEMGEKLHKMGEESALVSLSHYACELALLNIEDQSLSEARKYLKKALAYDDHCVRASLILGDLELKVGNSKQAIQALKIISQQNPNFISEAVPLLYQAYKQLNQEAEAVTYLVGCLEHYPSVSLASAMAEMSLEDKNIPQAKEALLAYLKSNPSLAGLKKLIEVQMLTSDDETKRKLEPLKSLAYELVRRKPTYLCSHCGFAGKRLHWQCPTCKQWNTVKPIAETEGESIV